MVLSVSAANKNLLFRATVARTQLLKHAYFRITGNSRLRSRLRAGVGPLWRQVSFSKSESWIHVALRPPRNRQTPLRYNGNFLVCSMRAVASYERRTVKNGEPPPPACAIRVRIRKYTTCGILPLAIAAASFSLLWIESKWQART